MNAAASLQCYVSASSRHGYRTVCCDIYHFTSSGLTVSELIEVVRGSMLWLAREIAAVQPDSAVFKSDVRGGCDVGMPDPMLTLYITKPVQFLADPDRGFEKMQTLVESLLATNRPCLADGGSDD